MSKSVCSFTGMVVLISSALVYTAPAAAQSVVAFENATIQPFGPRQGSPGEAFFNIEGVDNGNFASFGVARFDIADIKRQFDTDFGEAGWTVESVSLLLTQFNAGFTTGGAVDVFFTSNDESEIFPGGDLYYPFDDNFPDALLITDYGFVEVENGELETHGLYDAGGINSDGGTALKDDILSDTMVTLALVDADTAVAATYAGYIHDTYDGPTLQIIAAAVNTVQLQAGDADQDLQFNQFDLIQVQVADKYLSGQAATWGEGDWDGAPGGTQGNPPAGDGLFNQLDIVASQAAGLYLTGPYGAVQSGGQEDDSQASVGYNANTGEVSVDAPAGVELTSINIDSAMGVFTGQPAENLGGSFDNDADDNIFKATFGGSFGSISFGNVAATGLSRERVQSDLTVVGSLAGGGDLGDVDLIYIPEPSTLGLLAGGLLGLFCRGPVRRRR